MKNISPRIIEEFNRIQREILEKGWDKILQAYHPDNNYEHPDAFKLFQLYKEIYAEMKKKLNVAK